MRLKEFKFIVETVTDTQDIIKISGDIIDYLFANKITIGTTIDVSAIPGLTATTPSGQTLINSTRIKVVEPRQGPRGWNGSAEQEYTNSRGQPQGPAYHDARISKDVNRSPGVYNFSDPSTEKSYKDLISHRASNGDKLTVRLNANLIDLGKPGSVEKAQSTLSHELTHISDTIKGKNLGAGTEKFNDAEEAKSRLEKHNNAKKLVTPENPNPPGLTDPGEEKRLRKLVKNAPKADYYQGGSAYWKDSSEINARLTQASEDLAILIKNNRLPLDNNNINKLITHFLETNQITNCFVNFKLGEKEFLSSLRNGLTSAETKQAYADPEFKKLYNRLYKFLEAEAQPGGTIALAQQNGFKNWATASIELAGKTPEATFIQRFIQQVVKGIESAKDIGKLILRYNHMADAAFNKLLAKLLPELLMKGAFKSIPLVGALIGVAFGIDRLIKGDLPGAGLEVASGIGGLATAIPATAYQAARDLYKEYYTYADNNGPAVFEYDMAKDPTGTAQRIKELTAKIAEQLNELLGKNQRTYQAKFAANQRNAIQNMDTPGNPSPYLHPELYPQQESLDRIVRLSKYKS